MAWIKEKVTTAIDISDGFARLVAVSSDKTGKYLFVMDSVRVPSDDESCACAAVEAPPYEDYRHSQFSAPSGNDT